MIDENKWEIVSETADEIVLRKKRDDWDQCSYIVTLSGTIVEPDKYIIREIIRETKNMFNSWPSRELAEKAATRMRVKNALVWAKLKVEPEFEPDWSDEFQEKWCPSTGECWLNREDDGLEYYSTQQKAQQARQLLIDAGVWEAGDE